MNGEKTGIAAGAKNAVKYIKCVIWDLDNTLWRGILLEDEQVVLREGVINIIQILDSRGILQSIASRNDHTRAIAKLQEFNIAEYFLYPHINWNSKSSSIKKIAELINIGLDTVAFIDDQPFELEEVKFSLPEVFCLNTTHLDSLVNLPEINPPFLTQDARSRRLLYLSEIERKQVEEEFTGTNEEFLATLNLSMTIAPASEDDLLRAEELTVRTHQLNTTGYTYSYDELDYFRQSEGYTLLIAELSDKYGGYGKIGLALLERRPDAWIIKLLLMSCRVMSRGVGTIMISHIMHLAKEANVRLLAEFIPNDRNRMMYVTYKFSGFREIDRNDDMVVLEHDLSKLQPFPTFVMVNTTA